MAEAAAVAFDCPAELGGAVRAACGRSGRRRGRAGSKARSGVACWGVPLAEGGAERGGSELRMPQLVWKDARQIALGSSLLGAGHTVLADSQEPLADGDAEEVPVQQREAEGVVRQLYEAPAVPLAEAAAVDEPLPQLGIVSGLVRQRLQEAVD